MDKQVNKQIAFMTMAFGGPHNYTGRDLRTAHARLVERGLMRLVGSTEPEVLNQ